MKKTLLAVFSVFVILQSGLILSCKGKESDSKKFQPRFSANTSCQIRIAGNYKNFEALEAEFDRFNEFYPKVELSFSYLDNYNSTIKSAVASDSAPDIFMTFQWMLGRPDYKEVLENSQNMDDEKTLGFNLSTIRSQLICRTDDGKVPLIPVLTGSYGMLVNEEIFKKEGLPLPASYSQLVESCKKLKEAGYKSPIMAFIDNFMALPMIYPYFCKSIKDNPEAIELLNKLEPTAGHYLRPSLEWVNDFMKKGFVDIENCLTIKNRYDAVIMRFFEGNVPIMLCDADTASGTLKRESQSDAFIKNPFKYSFRMFPSTDDGSVFLNSVAVGLSVNKKSKNLAMADEFMRFLIRTEELNNLAKIKRLVTASTDYSFDEIYASLSESSPLYISELGLADDANKQFRAAVQNVLLGTMTVDEAVANYGKF